MNPETSFQAALNEAVAAKARELPQEILGLWVERFFAKRQKYLQLAAWHRSPLYVLETDILERKCREFQEVFAAVLPEVRCYFAMKSNNCPEVARIVLENGFGLDVSSGAELQTALYLGAGDIVFSGPGKTRNELDQAVAAADRTVVLVDSFGELDRLQRAAAAYGCVIRAGVRLTIDPRGLWRKFGIALEDLPEFQRRAAALANIDLQGIQFHCSWNMGPERQVDFLARLGKALSAMPAEFLQNLRFVDIGGGYWPPQGEWMQEAGTPAGAVRKAVDLPVNTASAHYWNPAEPIAVFAEELGAAIRRHILPLAGCRICLEPGRWLVNDSMHLLMTVVDKKAADLAITDAGTNAVGWERFEVDYFPVLNLSRPGLAEQPCTLFGSLCTPHDVWGYSYWGTGLEEGDVLLIPMQGAYTYSLRQEFIKPLPQVVAV